VSKPSITAVVAVTVAALLSLTCGSPPPTPIPTTALTGSDVVIHRVASSPVLQGRPAIDVELRSERPFPPRNEIAVLRIGTREFLLSRYPDSGDTHVLIFTLSVEEFAATSEGDPVALQYGRGEQPDRWYFGPLNKTLR
jgi:hypothetical protein